MKKVWLHFWAIPVLSFGIYWLLCLLFDLGVTGLGGLLTMGMLLFGWPGASVWLGMSAGKDLKHLWFLPTLFALTMPFVFPYYNAVAFAWGYAGVVLLVGLIAMIGTRLTKS